MDTLSTLGAPSVLGRGEGERGFPVSQLTLSSQETQ